MDPLSTVGSAIAIADGAMNVGEAAGSALTRATRKLMLAGTYEPEWLTLGVFEGEQSEFSAREIDEIHAFLASSAIKPVLSLLSVGLLLQEAVEGEEIADSVRGVFLNEAKKWSVTRGQSWSKKAGAIFDSLFELYSGVLPSKLESREVRDEIQSYSVFLNSPLSGAGSSSLVREYIGHLISLLQDLPALDASMMTADRLIGLIKAGGGLPIISHAAVDTPVAFEKLYVSRDFTDISTNESRPSDALISSSLPFRLFIMGSPGAGKTTFVNYLVSALTDQNKRDNPLPSVVVKCRNYARESWDLPFRTFIANELSSQYQTDVDASTAGNLLLLGRVTVIFDGLDEITDVSRRQQMVQRIQAFTAQYPPVSILITTRELGYNQAPLDQKIFDGVRLQEFSVDQVREYCNRWFAAYERPELTEHFMRDSESVADLRENPLLLSLLCILYRSSGAIPANRRSIYQQCAHLLFHRWDQARQIKTNEAMPEYGDELMQEIARWIFTSESARAGLQEQVLVKTLANYLESAIGYKPTKALTVASEFAEYCAGRAWLLGTIGTENGQRIFAFTHRTFYEYFAAEAYARLAKSEGEVAARIMSAYSEDSTSVLPELLIQSFGYHSQRGDAHVFKEITQQRAPSVLLLRLMNGSRLPSPIRAKGFEQTINEWKRGNYGESFNVLLSTNEAARDQFWDDFILPPERRSERELFIAGWAGLQLSGTAPANLHQWETNISSLLATYSTEVATYRAPSTINWLMLQGSSAAGVSNVWEYLVCHAPQGWVPGVIWWSLVGVLENSRGPLEKKTQDLIERMHQALVQGNYLRMPVLERLSDALVPFHSEALRWKPEFENVQSMCIARELVAFFVLGISETYGVYESVLKAVSPCWPGDFASLPLWRDYEIAARPIKRRTARQADLAQTIAALPPRLQRWAAGEGNLLDQNSDTDYDREIAIRFLREPPTNIAAAIKRARVLGE